MDARAPSSPGAGSAVSGLMQQLKNGEISKMQLFQQIARLQATSAQQPAAGHGLAATMAMAPPASANPPPAPPSFGGSASFMFGGAPVAVASATASVPFVTFNYSPPRAPAVLHQDKPSGSHTSPAPVADTATTSRLGPPPLPSEADALSAGVSHDKAQRLSVQEWMASKMRGSVSSGSTATGPAAAQVIPSVATPSLFGTALTQRGDQLYSAPVNPVPPASSTEPSLFAFMNPPQHERNDSPSFPVGANDLRQATRVQKSPNDPSSSTWTPSQPASGSHDPRYENETTHTGGLLAGNDYLHFDPFQDGPHSHDDSTGTSGKAKGGRSGDERAFHTRVTRWKSQKDAVREQMKQQLLQSELDECTFTPKVNPKSTKVVAKLRGRQRSVGGSGGGEIDGVGNGIAVSERLYQEADNYKAREELAARLKAEEEAERERECTFRPKINKNNPMTEKVKPKYRDIPKRDAPVITPAAIEAAAKELEQCTFVPQVNAISHEMVSAQLYLQQNIYDRLSRPCVAASSDVGGHGGEYRGNNGDDDGGSDDLDGVGSPRLCTQDDMCVRSFRRRGSGAGAGSGHRPRSAGGIVTDAEKVERAKQFEEFLERQTFHEQAKKKRLQATQQQLEPTHRPSINKKSTMMMENGRKGDFLERISQYAIRKEQDTVKNKTVRVADPHCTFKPTINPTSAKRSARSVTELSRGDLLRRETSQRLMKLKMEQEEMASLTFRPELSRASQRVEGRLKILTSPDTYLQRIQQQSQAHMVKQRRALQEKEMEEFSECTFKPRTIDAPAYVQRIARSVVLTKALKKQQEAVVKANQKPEWK